MTAQAEELLLLDGRCEWLQSLPLQGYLDDHKIDLRQFNTRLSSSLWRGYRASWEIADERLYLIGLVDCVDHPFDPGIVFPGRSLPIAADWFSGRLALGQGEALTYFHMGWGHEYETMLRLYFERGRLVARRRYDQTRLLRRRFDRFVTAHPDWLQVLVDEARCSLQPLGGFTAAGLRALQRPELEVQGIVSTWPGSLTDEEYAEIAGDMLEHCTRPPGGCALAIRPTSGASA